MIDTAQRLENAEAHLRHLYGIQRRAYEVEGGLVAQLAEQFERVGLLLRALRTALDEARQALG